MADPLSAMMSGSPPMPGLGAPPDTAPAVLDPSAPEVEIPGAADAEEEDKMMLVEDFRTAAPEDALAAFDALLSAFKVKRS